MPILVAVPNPNPNGDGSELSPYGAQQAIDAAKPDDTVLLRGEFSEPIQVKSGGEPDAPVTVAAHEDGCIFDGGFTFPRLPANGAHLKNPKTGDIAHYVPLVAVQASHVIVRDLVVRNSLGRGIGVGKNNAILKGVQVINCHTDWSRGAGLNFNDAEDIFISGCIVERSGCFMQERRDSHATNWPVALAIVRCKNIMVDNTISSENWGEGIAIGRGSSDATVTRSVFANNMAVQLYFNRCARATAIRNLIYQSQADPGPGFVINNEDMKEPPCTDLIVAHNIAVGNQHNYAIWGNAGGNEGSSNVLFAHNTSALAHKAAWRMLKNANKNIRLVGNLTYQPGGNFQDGGALPDDWHFERNAWSGVPPAYLRGNGDIYGADLVNPIWPSPAFGIEASNYAAKEDYAPGPCGGVPPVDYYGRVRKGWTAGAIEFVQTAPPAEELVRLLVSTQMSTEDAAKLRTLLSGKAYTVELA